MTLYTIKLQNSNSINNIINNNHNFDSKNEEIKIMNRLRISEIEKKAAWKIISYILLFILQWLPVQINIATRWTTVCVFMSRRRTDTLFLRFFFYRFVKLGLIF